MFHANKTFHWKQTYILINLLKDKFKNFKTWYNDCSKCVGFFFFYTSYYFWWLIKLSGCKTRQGRVKKKFVMSKLNLVLCSSEATASSRSSCHGTKTCLHPPTLSCTISLKWSVSSLSFYFFTWPFGKNDNTALFSMQLCSCVSRNIESKWKHSKSNELYRGMILSDS